MEKVKVSFFFLFLSLLIRVFIWVLALGFKVVCTLHCKKKLFEFEKKMSCGGDIYEEVNKDPGIKLFGRTIPLPECQIQPKSELMDACSDITKAEVESSYAENLGKHEKSTDLGDRNEEPQTRVQVEPQVNCTPKEGQIDTNSTENEKVFKKPDKILQCPRCNSLDTKFCYFNNYNVNQPRHFCKNCHRYWTAGGTMRNVPVGAGRRKNKHLTSQYRHIIVSSDGVQTTRLEAPDSTNHQLLSCGESSTAFRSSIGNETVLKFGPEAPLCESMESVLNLRDQKRCAEMGPVNLGDNGEEPSSCRSSMTASSNQGKHLRDNVVQKERVGLPGSCHELNTPHPLHYPLAPWGVPWNAGLHNVTSVVTAQQTTECVSVPNSSDPNSVRLYPTPMLAVPGFCPPQVPVQFVPASYWGCMPVWGAGAGGMSLNGSSGCLSPSSSASNSCCSGNGSTLGKHSRHYTDEEKSETCVLVPKTLRIDDPDEASKSPIWATLGIKPDQKESMSKGTIFETFERKVDDKGHLDEASNILEANPAALSRSHTFQEST